MSKKWSQIVNEGERWPVIVGSLELACLLTLTPIVAGFWFTLWFMWLIRSVH